MDPSGGREEPAAPRSRVVAMQGWARKLVADSHDYGTTDSRVSGRRLAQRWAFAAAGVAVVLVGLSLIVSLGLAVLGRAWVLAWGRRAVLVPAREALRVAAARSYLADTPEACGALDRGSPADGVAALAVLRPAQNSPDSVAMYDFSLDSAGHTLLHTREHRPGCEGVLLGHRSSFHIATWTDVENPATRASGPLGQYAAVCLQHLLEVAGTPCANGKPRAGRHPLAERLG
jgi:hypothetical protein